MQKAARTALNFRPGASWFCLLAATWLSAANVAGDEAKSGPATLVELQQRLTNLVTHPRFEAALWGVKVVSLDTGRTLFEHNPRKLFSPASNTKLYSVAVALDRLGEDYRIRTSLYAKQRPEASGTLAGDLILYGRGDPTINSRRFGGNLPAAIEPLVSALTNAGVRRVTGNLVADSSFFRGPELGSGWAWDDSQNYYGAEISALTINDNAIQVGVKPGERPGLPGRVALTPTNSYLTLVNRSRTVEAGQRRTIRLYRPIEQNVVHVFGEVPLEDPGYTADMPVHEPAGLFLIFFRESLTRRGVRIEGESRVHTWLDALDHPTDCDGLIELGSMSSLPLRDISREILKPSQNLYTDLLLAHLGESVRKTNTSSAMTSEDLGIRELERFLPQAGIAGGDVFFEEGSGLSRNNLTTPNATVALLQYMSRHKTAEAYRDALPIAGLDGTLRRRFQNTAAAGNVRAKTGTLRWANSLSGYVTTAAGERLAFALMLNRYHSVDPAVSGRSELDAITVLLASYRGR